MSRYLANTLLLALMLSWTAWAQAAPLLPEVPPAKKPVSDKQKCVDPIDDIRRNHMDRLKHHRVEATRKGIRTNKYSLSRCINCHVKPLPGGGFPTHKDKRHFCAACHQFAGVSIDCFHCHRDKPDDAAAAAGLAQPEKRLTQKRLTQRRLTQRRLTQTGGAVTPVTEGQ